MSNSYDFLVIGSGFGGCLLALILRRIGFDVLVIDKTKHPRFAIGESSTPIADSILKTLTQKYDLTELASLASYGEAKRKLPNITVGCKRGFSYFSHAIGEKFDGIDGANQLLVAASSSEQLSDTHWFRSEVDFHFARQLKANGVDFMEETQVSDIEKMNRWMIRLMRKDGQAETVETRFIVDASGHGGVLLNHLGIEKSARSLMTESCAVYGHFENVRPWSEQFRIDGGDESIHPFVCERAAVHHLLDSGWMWQLRFDNDITSAGFAWNLSNSILPGIDWNGESGEQIWQKVLSRYPSLRDQFANQKMVAPAGGIRKTGRMQFLAESLVGTDWCVLPGTAGFIDPLHSTGIAHTMSAIEYLSHIFERHSLDDQVLGDQLKNYEKRLTQEFLLIDRLVHVCYQTLSNFEQFVAATMLYFAAATYYEYLRAETSQGENLVGFLNANDDEFSRRVDQAIQLLGIPDPGKDFSSSVKELIEPYNVVGLCDDSVSNMYRYTSAPNKF